MYKRLLESPLALQECRGIVEPRERRWNGVLLT
jgi:hypothetical protein